MTFNLTYRNIVLEWRVHISDTCTYFRFDILQIRYMNKFKYVYLLLKNSFHYCVIFVRFSVVYTMNILYAITIIG